MSLPKLFNRIIFHNNTTPALNETNLNLVSKAVDDIDDRVIDIAGTVMETVPQIQEDLEEAQDLLEDAEAISTHPPIIGQNGNWWTWDTTIEDYADSGVDAGVSVTIGTTSTLTPGSDATVTNSGTDTDPILNFGIPAGVAGQNGQDGADGADGADGVSPTVTIGTITGGHSVTITDADHPTGQTFNVMDGTDGADGEGVPTGGTTGQVLAKASGTDYDTEWITPSGGSGGHTILDSSGTAMAQRGKLQFDGATVTDDSANDKTIITGTPQSMIGDAWVSGHAYAVGDYCIDGNVLYKCKTAHTSSASYRPPYASYWDATPVASQFAKSVELLSSPIVIPNSMRWNASTGHTEGTLSEDITNFDYVIATVALYVPYYAGGVNVGADHPSWTNTVIWTKEIIENSIYSGERGWPYYIGPLPNILPGDMTKTFENNYYSWHIFFNMKSTTKIVVGQSLVTGWSSDVNNVVKLISIKGIKL